MAQPLPLADQVAVVRSTEGLFYESTHEDLILALITAAPRLSQAHRKLLDTALNRLRLLSSPLLEQNRLSTRQGGGSSSDFQPWGGVVGAPAGCNTGQSTPPTRPAAIAHNTSEEHS